MQNQIQAKSNEVNHMCEHYEQLQEDLQDQLKLKVTELFTKDRAEKELQEKIVALETLAKKQQEEVAGKEKDYKD